MPMRAADDRGGQLRPFEHLQSLFSVLTAMPNMQKRYSRPDIRLYELMRKMYDIFIRITFKRRMSTFNIEFAVICETNFG
jgi:hypothetical protein